MNTFNDLDSLYNKKAKLYKKIKIEKKVEICDLTLEADGEEMAGLKFKEAERLQIAKILDEVGVHRIAIIGNSPTPTKVDIKSAEKILNLNLKARTNGFVKTKEEGGGRADLTDAGVQKSSSSIWTFVVNKNKQ